jgi:hypothetical protein
VEAVDNGEDAGGDSQLADGDDIVRKFGEERATELLGQCLGKARPDCRIRGGVEEEGF